MTKRDQKILKEARGAIARLQATLSHSDNRGGEYGRNCRDAIARWEATIKRIEGNE
jgi:hypothetical protein